jgi:hypothetical protein
MRPLVFVDFDRSLDRLAAVVDAGRHLRQIRILAELDFNSFVEDESEED